MDKSGTRISIAILAIIDIFVVGSGIYFHEVPYWAVALLSNAIGLFLGFVLAAIVESRREYIKKYGNK